jgi:UDP-galactopyranose mutase
MYDFLIVGAGLFGSVFARSVRESNAKVLVIDKRKSPGGNVLTSPIDNIQIHTYGPHIFHSDKVWAYVNKFAEFNSYQHRAKANFDGKIYSLPFNLNTFYQLWGCITPEQARDEINRRKIPIENPSNLEQWALSQVGEEVYHKLIYGYTKKQWMREPRDLPASILKRIPIRFTFDENYFDDPFQGIPVQGYSRLIENIVDGVEIKLETDFRDIADWRKIAKKLVYSGPIDELCGYQLGELEYRALEFDTKVVDGDFQGTAIMNYTHESIPYTRITEHKHFLRQQHPRSVITYEYPVQWTRGKLPFYPVNDQKNNELYERYKALVPEDIIVGGRLGRYKYYNMDQVIASALTAANFSLAAPSNVK